MIGCFESLKVGRGRQRSVSPLQRPASRRNRVYEVLKNRRPLTLKVIWRSHKGVGVAHQARTGSVSLTSRRRAH
jgi:hypothetical protein